MRSHKTRGFTLIELIITISVLAILITILVISINPAEHLARARDTRRTADLDSLGAALNLYMAQATTTPNLSGDATPNNRCVGGAGVDTFFVNTTGVVGTPPGFAGVSATTTQVVGATGWLPARIDQTPGGASIAKLPLDPTNGIGNSATHYYGFACNTSQQYELTARLESAYYRDDLDADGTDGGNSSSTYETGITLTLIPNAY